MKTVRTVVVFFILSVSISCSEEPKNNNDSYENYKIGDNSWRSKKVYAIRDAITYGAVEVPLEYYIIKSVGEDLKIVDSIYNESKHERVIEITFEHKDNKDLLLEDYTKKSYEDAVKYTAFAIQQDFEILTSSSDTIICSGVHFERNFKVAPFKKVLLYFNNINPEDQISLIYKDSLFGKGIIKFNFNQRPLKL